MEIKIGNEFIITHSARIFLMYLIFAYGSAYAGGDLELEIFFLSMQGHKIKEVEAGYPFKMVIDFKSYGPEYFDTIELENPGPCTVIDKSIVSKISSVASRRTMVNQYVFTMQAQELGVFSCGPLRLEGKIGSYSVGPFNISVVMPHKREKKYQSQFFIEASLQKESVYVYERVPLQLKVYYLDDPDGKFYVKIPPSSETFSVIGQSDYVVTNEKIDHMLYKVETATLFVAPQKAGDFVFSSIKAVLKRAGFSGFFSMSFDLTSFADPVYMKVKPLPPHDEKVDAVGTFSSFVVEVDSREISVGSALKVSCTLIGQADFKMLHELNMVWPDGVKYYVGDQKISSDGLSKTFEYFVQPLVEQDLIFPAQKFVYFDVDQERYNSLISKKIHVKVTPSLNNNVDTVHLNDSFIKEPVQEGSIDLEPILIFQKMPYEPGLSHELPWWIMMSICVVAMFWFMRDNLKKYFSMLSDFFVKRNACRAALKRLNEAEKAQRMQDIFPIIMQFLIQKRIISQLSLDDVAQGLFHLQSKGKIVQFLSEAQSWYYAPAVTFDAHVFKKAKAFINEISSML